MICAGATIGKIATNNSRHIFSVGLKPLTSYHFHDKRRLSSTVSNGKVGKKTTLHWLDLQGSGLSALERLCLEEALLRHDPLERSWAIVGYHDPTYSRRLRWVPKEDEERGYALQNENCVIIMGIGGKAEALLDLKRVREEGVLVLKRFSGGGTVVVDHSSLWTTFIGRNHHFPHVPAYPRDIMQWSADAIFGPAFQHMNKSLLAGNLQTKTLIVPGKSCGVEAGGKVYTAATAKPTLSQTLPKFELVENDYVLGGRKMGGNAQSIIKNGWLHHSSFLWDYEDHNMQYLTLPSKRPEYRGNRSHDEFLVKLQEFYSPLGKKNIFFNHVREAADKSFQINQVSLKAAMEVVDTELGGFQNWFETKCRTKIVQV